jgi:organic radical activating enzyme
MKLLHVIQNADMAVGAKWFEQNVPPGQLLVTSIFATIQGEGPLMGHPALFIRLAGCNFGNKSRYCQFCFPEGTIVHSPNHSGKPVEEYKVGDELFALDDRGDLTTTKIKKVMTHSVPAEDLVEIVYQMPDEKGTRTLICTKDHPFHTTKRGFVSANSLRKGEKIYHVKGKDLRGVQKTRNNPMHDKRTVSKNVITRMQRFAAGEYDMSRTPEQKARYSQSKLGDKNPMKRHEVRLANMLTHAYPPSKLEYTYASVFKTLGVRAAHVSLGSRLIIGDDVYGYRIPDFHLKGTNKVIEVYDKNYRYCKKGKRVRRTKANYEEPTQEFYKKFGYDVLFLTNIDLQQPKVGSGNARTTFDYTQVTKKVGMFLRNGATVLDVRTVSSRKAWGLARKSNKENPSTSAIKVVNFSCSPYNTFIVNGLHTHNCDTAFQVAQGRLYTPEALLDAAIKVAVNAGLSGWSWEWPSAEVSRRMVITGGEPLLQTPSLAKFFKVVHDFDPSLEVQIETNGTLFPEDKLNHDLYPMFVVSPKGVYTDISSQKKSYPDGKYLHRWVHGSKDYSYGLDVFFKFVVDSDSASPHHDVTPEVLENFNRRRTFVSPMAAYARPYSGEVADAWEPGLLDVERTRANYRHAANLCMKYGTTLSIQQHLFTAQP